MLRFLAVLCLLAVCSAAFAQADPPTLNSVMTAAGTDVKAKIFEVIGQAVVLLSIFLGLRYGWVKLAQAAKTNDSWDSIYAARDSRYPGNR